jgi:hypothetical protein
MFIEPKIFRNEGVSSGFSFNTQDYKSQEELEMDLIGAKNKKMLFLNQEHTDKIALYPGSDLETPFDAIITQRKGYHLFLKTADCNPILFFDTKKKVAGAIHAGWKGINQKIITKTLQLAEKKFRIDINSTKFVVGPSIRACCYEVKEDLMNKFKAPPIGNWSSGTEDFFIKRGDKFHFDQIEAINQEFHNLGVKEESIEIIDQCTHCSSQFFSYRYDKTTMRNISFIGIK